MWISGADRTELKKVRICREHFPGLKPGMLSKNNSIPRGIIPIFKCPCHDPKKRIENETQITASPSQSTRTSNSTKNEVNIVNSKMRENKTRVKKWVLIYPFWCFITFKSTRKVSFLDNVLLIAIVTNSPFFSIFQGNSIMTGYCNTLLARLKKSESVNKTLKNQYEGTISSLREDCKELGKRLTEMKNTIDTLKQENKTLTNLQVSSPLTVANHNHYTFTTFFLFDVKFVKYNC